MKLLYLIIFFLMLFSVSVTKVEAIVDPLLVPNNKYGIHIIDENDLKTAADLINSTGGDWGYVTMVVSDTDRNIDKWQKNFDYMRSLHLIPIIRIATHPVGDTWAKPKIDDIDSWVKFLSNLYWVTKNRYVILFNEPNHASEWGGTISPAEYAQVLTIFARKLKGSSPDYFVLPAGLDASAPNSINTADEANFMTQMIVAQPDVFSYIDGWTSHSYPNPGFHGKTTDSGRGTLKTYKWEMEFLKSLGQKSEYPIFITETGWAHMEGIPANRNYFTAEILTTLIREASENVWNDPRIVAVTPFILNYQAYPFANFSWQKVNGEGFYSYFDTYKSLPKISGKPKLNSIFDNFSGLNLFDLTPNYSSGNAGMLTFLDINKWRSFFYQLFKL